MPTPDVQQSESAQSESDLLSRMTNAISPSLQDYQTRPSEEESYQLEQQEDVANVQDDSSEQALDDSQDQPDESSESLVTLEHLGKSYKVPESLKVAFEANRAHGTRASQEAAEIRKAIMLEKQSVELENSFRKSAKSELDLLSQIDAQISQLSKSDWSNLDTDTLVRTRHALDTLKDRRSDIQQQVQGKLQDFQRQLQDHQAQVKAYGIDRLSKSIPNWSDSVAAEIAKFAQSKGFTQDEISAMNDYRAVEVMHDAMQWRRLQDSKKSFMKKAAQVSPSAKPGSSASTANNASRKQQLELRNKLKKSGDVRDAAAWYLSTMK